MNARISTLALAGCLGLLGSQPHALAQLKPALAAGVQQTTGNAVEPGIGKTKENKGPDSGPPKYANSELDFSFSYPAEFQSESQELLAAKWKKATDASGPKYKASDACTHVLFHASRNEDSNGSAPSIAIYGQDHSPRVEVTIPVRGSITITEMSQQCLPEEFKGREDELLSGFASAAGEEPGMKLIGQSAWYEISGHKLHAGIAESVISTDTAVKTAVGPRDFLVIVAGNISGHIVLWMLEAKDSYSINQLIHGTVAFGAGQSQPLLPLDVESKTN
jgi:hypothetical protein